MVISLGLKEISTTIIRKVGEENNGKRNALQYMLAKLQTFVA